MKKLYCIVLSVVFIGLMTQGFSCGSADFEGAKLYITQNKPDDAIRLLEKEIKNNPKNDDALYLLGETKGKMGDYAGMNDAFEKALKISDNNAERIKFTRFEFWRTHVNNAVPFVKPQGGASPDYLKAAEEYKKASEAWPDTSASYYYMGIAYNGAGDIDKSAACFEKAWKLGKDTASYDLYGRCCLRNGEIKKKNFEEANKVQLKALTGLKEISKGASKSDVTEAFGAPDNKKKDGKNSKREDWTYNKCGVTFTMEGDIVVNKKINKKPDLKIDSSLYREAVNDYNKAIEPFELLWRAHPDDSQNLQLVLNAYVGADRIKEATKLFKQAVDKDPGNKINRQVMGILFRTIEEYDNAISEFKKALEIDPGFNEINYQIGATYLSWGNKLRDAAKEKGDGNNEFKKKYELALPWLEKVVELNPDNVAVWERLAQIYALLGKTKEANKAFDKVDAIRKTGK